MNHRLPLLLSLTFIESYVTILIERGIYFYTGELLGYSDTTNLLMALGLGVTYAITAHLSHHISNRIGERRLLFLSIAGQIGIHALMWLMPHGPMMFVGTMFIGAFNGLKWPVVESFVGAGQTPEQTSKVLGKFNIAWSAAVPVSLATAGPIIAHSGAGMFLVAAILNGITLLMVCGLVKRPVHLPHDHPDRLPPHTLQRYGLLLRSCRWTMLSSYTLLFLVSPLMPGIFSRLGVPLVWATGFAALIDVMRLATFALMGKFPGWHGKVWVPVFALIGLPLGFLLTISGYALSAVLVGEVLFGLTIGVCYCAALYYIMLISNASVEAGGAHEGLIGLGLGIGPGIGLLGRALAVPMGHALWGTLAASVPFVLGCGVLAARPLFKLKDRLEPTTEV